MLDPSGRKEIMAAMKRLNKEQNITVITITHYMNEAIEADRVLVMDHGKICMDGTPKEVFSQVELMDKQGLSVPETTRILHDLRADGFDLPLDALAVDACADVIARVFKV